MTRNWHFFAKFKFFLGSPFPTDQKFKENLIDWLTNSKSWLKLKENFIDHWTNSKSPWPACIHRLVWLPKKMTKAEWPSKQGVVSVVQLDDLSLCSFAAAMSYCTSEGRVGPRSQVHQMWQPTALMDQLALTKDKTFIRIIFIYFEPEFDGDFKKGRYA